MKKTQKKEYQCDVRGKKVLWLRVFEMVSGIGDDGSIAYDEVLKRCHNEPECSTLGLLDRCPLRSAEQ